MQLKPIHEQVAVVFGASSGIGRETAVRLARRGARVVAAARSRDGLDSLVDTVRSFGGQAIAQVADVTDFEQVRGVADAAVREYGHLDTWVHAAAVAIYATFEQTTPEEFRRVIEVNLVGQAYGAKAALPHMRREGRGALIHISSVEANVALPLHSAYAASKHGIKGMLDALRRELKAEGVPISVTNIMPAGINTPFFNKARTKIGVKPMPMPPVYDASTVADVILYAAEHPVAELYAGGAARAFTVLQRVAPRLVDRVLARQGISSQHRRAQNRRRARQSVPARPGQSRHRRLRHPRPPSERLQLAGDAPRRPDGAGRLRSRGGRLAGHAAGARQSVKISF